MRVLSIIAFLTGCTLSGVYAQDDSDTTTVYRHGIPISEDDTVQNFPDSDLKPATHYRKLAFTELPTRVQRSLKKEKQFSGWDRDGSFYFDEVNKRYMISIRTGNMLRIFGLDENGKVVTFDEQPD